MLTNTDYIQMPIVDRYLFVPTDNRATHEGPSRQVRKLGTARCDCGAMVYAETLDEEGRCMECAAASMNELKLRARRRRCRSSSDSQG